MQRYVYIPAYRRKWWGERFTQKGIIENGEIAHHSWLYVTDKIYWLYYLAMLILCYGWLYVLHEQTNKSNLMTQNNCLNLSKQNKPKDIYVFNYSKLPGTNWSANLRGLGRTCLGFERSRLDVVRIPVCWCLCSRFWIRFSCVKMFSLFCLFLSM